MANHIKVQVRVNRPPTFDERMHALEVALGGARPVARLRRRPDCHPERIHAARGLCWRCYNATVRPHV